MSRVVALIPARGGSKRIPRKNLATIKGKTLVQLAIEATQESRRVQATYVSTDDVEIEQEALRYGAHVLVRPRHLATDEAQMDDVVSDFLLFAQLKDDDVVMLLEPTAPLRCPDDIDAIADLMLTTSAPAARMVRASADIKCHGFRYHDVGLASAIRVGSFDGCLFPQGTLLMHMGDERSIDVDTPEDLVRARALA